MPRDDSDRERRRRNSYDPESDRRRDPDKHRRRRTHRATDSQGDLLPTLGDRSSRDYDSSTPSQRERRRSSSRATSSNPLRSGSLAQLDQINAKRGWKPGGYDESYLQEVREKEERLEKERRREQRRQEKEHRHAEREAQREERRRIQELDAERELEAERLRLKEEERERRREEKRRLKRLEKERLRQMEDERNVELSREQERESEREQRRTQKQKERERSRREQEEQHSGYEYLSSEESRARRAHKSDKHRHSKYAEVKNEDSPRNRDLRKEHSPRKKTRVISGPYIEDGRSDEVYAYRKEKIRDEDSTVPSDVTTDSIWKRKRNKRICIFVAAIVLILLIAIPVGIVVSKKSSGSSSSSGGSSSSSASSSSSKPSNSNLNGINKNSIPKEAVGTYLDPFTWYDTTDFNVTYTDQTVAGLYIMGLNSTWNDDVQANPNVPSLKDTFVYGSIPVRGMNVGGWLSIEPFITPSFFKPYGDKVIDEWTLSAKMGESKIKPFLEQHYSSFINAQTFSDIRAAGFDHVRIPFSYWAVEVFDGDPYLLQVSWRYLLRGIEYARWNGLRVNLDLHGAPGSQNGWNHSGRQGYIGWLNGTDGTLNGQRTIDLHDKLTKFFTQPRYKNIITMYGLVNEPRMTALDKPTVFAWTENAVKTIRNNNMTAILVFGDGFMGLDNWQGKLQIDNRLLLDVHQYVIFNNDQMNQVHSDKLNFACKGWTAQMQRSMNKATGFGPTMCGEWSQADTDCATYLNNVGIGSRWEGTLNTGNLTTQVLKPQCPTGTGCSCTQANADPSTYSSAYKQFLIDFAQAQMDSFEQGWGWFYWTWKTESAVQWSWQLGVKAGILPKTIYDRTFSCNQSIPDFAKIGLPEFY